MSESTLNAFWDLIQTHGKIDPRFHPDVRKLRTPFDAEVRPSGTAAPKPSLVHRVESSERGVKRRRDDDADVISALSSSHYDSELMKVWHNDFLVSRSCQPSTPSSPVSYRRPNLVALARTYVHSHSHIHSTRTRDSCRYARGFNFSDLLLYFFPFTCRGSFSVARTSADTQSFLSSCPDSFRAIGVHRHHRIK